MSEIRPGDKHSPPGDYICWAPMAGLQASTRLKVNYILNKINKKRGKG